MSRWKPKEPIFVVVRVDLPLRGIDAQSLRIHITLVASMPDRTEAEAEASRLSVLNADKGCVYFCTPTRYFPEGRGVEVKY